MYLKSKISSYYILIIPWALIFICLLLLKRSAELFTIIFLLDVWLLSHPHAISTFTKKRVRKDISFFKIIMAVFFIGITLATISVKLSFVVVFNIYFFLQWFHYARQNYGITIRQKKSNLNRKVSFFIFHSIPVVSLIHLLTNKGFSFFGYHIYTPSFLSINSQFFHITFFMLFISWIFFELSPKTKKNLKYIIFSLSFFAIYYMSYFIVENFMFAWIGLTIFHNVQYLIYNWIDESEKELSFFRYYILILVLSLIIYGSVDFIGNNINSYFIPITIIISLSINFLHYAIDSVIWRKKF